MRIIVRIWKCVANRIESNRIIIFSRILGKPETNPVEKLTESGNAMYEWFRIRVNREARLGLGEYSLPRKASENEK